MLPLDLPFSFNTFDFTESDKPARNRQRRLTEIAPGRYACTLSDAISPVQSRDEDICKTP